MSFLQDLFPRSLTTAHSPCSSATRCTTPPVSRPCLRISKNFFVRPATLQRRRGARASLAPLMRPIETRTIRSLSCRRSRLVRTLRSPNQKRCLFFTNYSGLENPSSGFRDPNKPSLLCFPAELFRKIAQYLENDAALEAIHEPKEFGARLNAACFRRVSIRILPQVTLRPTIIAVDGPEELEIFAHAVS